MLEGLAAEPDPPTTVRDPAAAIDVHVADALVAVEVPAVAGARRIADLGAGAGFPGLVLACALPDATVDLIESSARKCAVIEHLGKAASLTNARAVAQRAEERAVSHREFYDLVTARALAPLGVLAEYAAPLLTLGGTLVAWKGRRNPTEESAGARAAAIVGLEPLEIRRVTPFPAARDRHLHVLRKEMATPERFPRRPGMARKRPLP